MIINKTSCKLLFKLCKFVLNISFTNLKNHFNAKIAFYFVVY